LVTDHAVGRPRPAPSGQEQAEDHDYRYQPTPHGPSYLASTAAARTGPWVRRSMESTGLAKSRAV
jgi:hypothetical protein